MPACLTALAVALAAGGFARAADPPAADDVRFFETRIRPLLAEHCFGCHGPAKQKSDLRLDSAAALKRGGDSGEPAVVPGKPDESRLIRAVRRSPGVAAMPPKASLSDRDLADLTRWVKAGAHFPAPAVPAGDGRHWAFDPPRRPAVPANPGRQPGGGGNNPIDAFVAAKLAEKGLALAAPADPRTLVRRVTFDLTGLPPTPEEIDAFEKDTSPDAYAKLVDRLLASPAYGEKWGRHWLDVARYADSNGLDENVAHGNAWRYRDYVVAAFNADKPYDRFLTEQVAGDLLPAADPAARREHLTATGFLALGPKVLAEPDERKMEFDLVDEQLDTLGRAVLGMTFGCARCHDHKFDPVTTTDYYALAGIFASTRTMETFKKVARWHENPLGTPEELARKAAHDKQVAAVKEKIKGLTGKADDESKAALKAAKDDLAALEKAAPEVPSAMGVTEGTVADAAVFRRGNHLSPGRVVPRRFPVVMAGESQSPLPADRSGRLELAQWLTRPDHPLTARVMVNRVWRWHFGRGIVASVDNFGLLGEKPTHPELLDWLACELMSPSKPTDGRPWALKHLHRLILLSATYRQSAAADPKAAAADPDNRLLGRFPTRRLTGEEIRDALLAVSGRLDRTVGGPALSHVKNRGYLFDHTSKDLTTYDSRRRSLYLPVIRNNLYDVFQLFDAADPAVGAGDRATTTVATQALFFLNSGLVADSADALAGRLAARPEPGRVRELYRLAYGRPPTAAEAARALKAVAALEPDGPDAAARRARAWARFCHAVLASNEFVTVN